MQTPANEVVELQDEVPSPRETAEQEFDFEFEPTIVRGRE
jgi:hypothetical protein